MLGRGNISVSVTVDLGVVLAKVKSVGYWNLSIPSDVDSTIVEWVEQYTGLSPINKALQKRMLTHEMRLLLLYFSERMATMALRAGDQEFFDHGLYALTAAFDFLDTREILPVLSLYHDTSIRHGLSFDRFTDPADSFNNIVTAFLRRKQEDKSIASMGYTIGYDELNIPRYQRIW